MSNIRHDVVTQSAAITLIIRFWVLRKELTNSSGLLQTQPLVHQGLDTESC